MSAVKRQEGAAEIADLLYQEIAEESMKDDTSRTERLASRALLSDLRNLASRARARAAKLQEIQ